VRGIYISTSNLHKISSNIGKAYRRADRIKTVLSKENVQNTGGRHPNTTLNCATALVVYHYIYACVTLQYSLTRHGLELQLSLKLLLYIKFITKLFLVMFKQYKKAMWVNFASIKT
jgi:hypothetical protein